MHHKLACDILEAIDTIILYEDMIGLHSDDEWNDRDYVCEEDVVESSQVPTQNDGPNCEPIMLFSNGPSTAPLGKCFYRQPNDKFHDNDPYMYYEAHDNPTDEEYFTSLFTLSQIDALVYNDEDYEKLRCEPLHIYTIMKQHDVDHRIPRKEWKIIKNYFKQAEKYYEMLVDEQDRIYDLQLTQAGL